MGSMLFLAGIIIVVSGLIAYIGDLVGRKMGRKRLTLFGLRPRHTAIIISVSMGMLIATLTLGATMLVDKRIRDSFFTPISDLKAQLKATQAQAAKANADIADTLAETQRVRALFDAKTLELSQTDRQLAVSRAQRRRIQRELDQARRELADVQKQLNGKQRELARISDRLSRTSAHLLKRSQEFLALQTEETRLTQMRDDLQGQVSELTERVQVLSEFARSSFAPLVFTSGQEIVSGLLPAGGAEARNAALKQLFAAAEKVVRQRSPEMDAKTPALLFVGGSVSHFENLDQVEAVKALAERVAALKSSAPVIVRLAPVNNVPVNGPALIAVQSVELEPNATIYHAGDVIAKMELTVTDGTRTADILGRMVEELLTARVPEALRARGVLMITRRVDFARPEQVPDMVLSRVPWTELLAVTQQVAARRGTVSVMATAHAAVTRYGPVDVSVTVSDGGK